MSLALLRDERDLVWLALSDVQRATSDVVFDVSFLAREQPGETPAPFLTASGYREPVAGIRSLLEGLGEAVGGDLTAMRHDPITDGLSLELKARGAPPNLTFEIVLWLDLTGMGPALRARGARGRHQSGLRIFVTRASLEEFRSQLFALALGDEDV